jgi:hypothetical protein
LKIKEKRRGYWQRDIREQGIGVLSRFQGHPGEFALPRNHQVAAAINKIRNLQVIQEQDSS